MGSLNRQTDIIQALNLRLKYQVRKPFSWILVFTKAIDLTIRPSLTLACALTTRRQKNFSSRISLSAARQGLVKASLKTKHLGFELTLKKLTFQENIRE
jgi:hypothetical protein